MLTYRVREDGREDGVELRLAGRRVLAHRMRWVDATRAWVVEPEPFAKALWDFGGHAVVVSEDAMPQALVEVASRVFGGRLRELDVPRQQGIFENCCSVCGVDRNTYPETAVRDGYGNILETRGRKWVAPDEPLRWRCHVCDRLVCRHCTLTRPDTSHPAGLPEYYYHTYCSEACRAAAPASFAHDDEQR